MTSQRISKKSKLQKGKKKSDSKRLGTSAKPISATQIQANIDRNKREKRAKLEKVLGKLSVNNQQDLGEALAENNLPAFLGGLALVDTNSNDLSNLNDEDLASLESSQNAMRNALQILRTSKIEELTRQGVKRRDAETAVLAREEDSPWLTDDEIRTLLSSPDKATREAGEQVMEALLKMCKYPKVIAAAIQTGGVAPIRENLQSEQALDVTQFQTGVIKWLRSNLTKLYFQSALMVDLQAAISALPANVRRNRNINIEKYIANVGFNRLMSGQNMFGASLSSDVDFKLVLDDEQLATDLGNLDPKGFNITEITKTIRKVLDKTQKKFEENFPLTLEVEDFTVKSLSTIEEQAQDNEKERNFLATVLNNQTLMSGNSQVQDKFKQVISNNLAAELAKRTWTQNLGESDKGSMEIIKALPDFEQALTTIGGIINNNSNLFSRAIRVLEPILKSELNEFNITINPLFIQNLLNEGDPDLIKKLLNDQNFSTQLLGIAGVRQALDSVEMFASESYESKLKLLSKLMLNFTEDGNRNFVGRPDLDSKKDWIYSVKFAGCRLFDMFDQTTVEDYIRARDASALDSEKAELTTTYNGGKQVASAINAFAVQLQNRIYEFYLRKGEQHENIDLLYPRMTASEFEEMLNNPDSRSKINVMLESLLNDLGESDSSTEPQLPEIIRNEIEQDLFILKSISESVVSGKDKSFKPKVVGLTIFDTIFKIANKTAQQLKPPSNE